MLEEYMGRIRLARGGPPRQVRSYFHQRRVILAAMGVVYFTDVVLTVFVLLTYPGSFSEANHVSAGIMSTGGILGWVVLKAILYAVIIANFTLLYVAMCSTHGRLRHPLVHVYLLAEVVLLGTLHIFYSIILVHNLVTVAKGIGV